MGICGRSTCADHAPSTVDRTLAALSIGSARLLRHWTGPCTRLASCDDGGLTSNRAGDAAVFDGRIDNGDDLRRALSRDDLRRLDNAQVALLCYEKWGDEFCNRIIGDYTCAIWDAQRRRLVMAVDPGGFRPLYYWLGPDEILFASEQRGLLSDAKVPKALDEDQMAAWLCHLPCEPLRSFYRDIFRVPPGRRVIWQCGAVRLERWWRPEHLPVLKLASDRDYEEALQSSLEEAVRCRIGRDELVGAHLSGGLDSSAVTATAARLLAGRGRRLTAFTAAPAHPAANDHNGFADEWPHAAALAAMYPNIDHVRIANDDAPLLDALDLREAGQDCPVLNLSGQVWINGIERAARERRIAIMLIAAAGNFTISYDGGELLSSQLRSARLFGAARTIRDLHRFGGRSWLGLLGEVSESVLPGPVLRVLRRAVGKGQPGLYDLSLVNPKFVRSKALETRARAVAGDMRNIARGNSRALRLAVFDRLDYSHWPASTRRLFGIDARDPTADRRLLELCLSIPDTQFLHRGVYRSLIRRAMAGIVPDQILRERRKGLQSADWRFGFDAALPGLMGELERLRHSTLVRQCLDLSRMEQLLHRWPGPDNSSEATTIKYLSAFSSAFAAGRFIQRIEGGNR
jgi:asparagine synthase (glutamine-hydrolysing)